MIGIVSQSVGTVCAPSARPLIISRPLLNLRSVRQMLGECWGLAGFIGILRTFMQRYCREPKASGLVYTSQRVLFWLGVLGYFEPKSGSR